jgi:hypothetical protein
MWNMAGVRGRNDSVSLLWVTKNAFQPRDTGKTAVYIESQKTISSDVIVVRKLAATGSLFLSSDERKALWEFWRELAGHRCPILGRAFPLLGKISFRSCLF